MPNSPQEWSLTLQGIIKPSAERKRLATVLGLSDMTLLRWASGESNPQRPHLIRLVHALQPQHRDEILGQLEKVYPEIHSWLKSNANESITSEFFAQVMHVRTTTTEHLRFWRISDMVLKQALLQLDPNISGLSVKLIRCMPLRDGKVRSIRECAGKGTPPWNNDLEHDVLFLGMESMSGYTTESRRFVNDGNLHKGKMIPAYPGEYEVSAIAQPIQFKGHIAGCLPRVCKKTISHNSASYSWKTSRTLFHSRLTTKTFINPPWSNSASCHSPEYRNRSLQPLGTALPEGCMRPRIRGFASTMQPLSLPSGKRSRANC